MSNDYRNESRRTQPATRWGTPGTSYPTANPYDVVITEEVAIRGQAYEPALYGTPHPVVSAAVLCHQSQVKSNNTDKAPIRVYANPRLAQEPYNLIHGDSEENDQNSPVFTRSYLLPRGYTKGTIGTALGAIIGLTVTAGGTGYASGLDTPGYGKVALSISGGATGYAEVAGGVVVAAVLTNSGSGFTSAPGIGISGGGSGATITSAIQPITALLVDESEQPAEEPYGGYFVRVIRKWETLPGPTITTTKYDPDSDTFYTEAKTLKATSSITEGATASGGNEIITEIQPVDKYTAYEVVKTFPTATAHDLASAIAINEDSAPYQFPATLDADQYTASSGLIGYTKSFVRKVPHLTKAFWVVSSTKPALSDYVTPPAPGSLFDFTLSGDPVGEVIYDAVDRVMDGITVHFPGSTPNLTTYKSTWVGNPMPVLGSVKEAGSRFRWKVEVIYVTMLLPALPTYS